jgi:hypothetical protein
MRAEPCKPFRRPQQRTWQSPEDVQLDDVEPKGAFFGWAEVRRQALTPDTQVFKRLGFAVSKLDCERVINAEPGECARVQLHMRHGSQADVILQAPSSKC